MTDKLVLDYRPWDSRTDVLVEGLDASTALGMIASATPLPARSAERKRDQLITKTLDGAIALIATSTEYLRAYGLTPEEVRSRVNAYNADKQGSPEAVNMRKARLAMDEPADPDNLLPRVSKTAVLS